MAHGACNDCGNAHHECSCEEGANTFLYDTILAAPDVVIMRGVSGAGKSTFVSLGRGACDIVCSADDYFNGPEGYRFDSSKLDEAHTECYRKYVEALDALEAGKATRVWVDNTNTESWQLAPYVMAAKSRGMAIGIVELIPDASVRDLADRNVHGVDEKTVCRQHTQLVRKLPHAWRGLVYPVRAMARKTYRLLPP